MKPKLLAFLNLIGVSLLISTNAYFGINGLNGNTVSSVSDTYLNLFTPADYAFSIWSLIFFGLAAQAIFLFIRSFQLHKSQKSVEQIGIWLFLANILNSFWLYQWLSLEVGISVLIMLGILLCLIVIILRTDMERWDAPLSTIVFIWWPICLYSGWIAVATIANLAAWFTAIDWQMGMSAEIWTMIMIGMTTGLGVFMTFARNMREFAIVLIWGLVAIAVRHWGGLPMIQYTALAGSLILFICTSYHASQNKETMPHKKLNF